MPTATAKEEPVITDEIQDPLLKLSLSIEKKIRNLDKKRNKLENYKLDLEQGKELNEDQLRSVEAYDRVVGSIEMCREFSVQIEGAIEDNLLFIDHLKKKHQEEYALLEYEHIKQILKAQYVLRRLSQKRVQEDFAAGKNGAVKIAEEKFSRLIESHEHFDVEAAVQPSDRFNSPKVNTALGEATEHLVCLIEGKNKALKKNVTYKELWNLILQISHSSYPKSLRSTNADASSPAPTKAQNNKKTKAKKPTDDSTQQHNLNKSSKVKEIKSKPLANGSVTAKEAVNVASRGNLPDVTAGNAKPNSSRSAQVSSSNEAHRVSISTKPLLDLARPPPLSNRTNNDASTLSAQRPVTDAARVSNNAATQQSLGYPDSNPGACLDSSQNKAMVGLHSSQPMGATEGPPPGISQARIYDNIPPSHDRYDLNVGQNRHQTTFYNSSVTRSNAGIGGVVNRSSVDIADLMGGMGNFNFLQESQVGNANATGEAAVYVDPAVVSFGSVKSVDNAMQRIPPPTTTGSVPSNAAPPPTLPVHSQSSTVPDAFVHHHQHPQVSSPPMSMNNGPIKITNPPVSAAANDIGRCSPPPRHVTSDEVPVLNVTEKVSTTTNPKISSTSWAAQEDPDDWGITGSEGMTSWNDFVAESENNHGNAPASNSRHQDNMADYGEYDYRKSNSFSFRNNSRSSGGYGNRGGSGGNSVGINNGYRGNRSGGGFSQYSNSNSRNNGFGGGSGGGGGYNNRGRGSSGGYRGRGNFPRARNDVFPRGPHPSGRGNRVGGGGSFSNNQGHRNSYQ